MKVYNLSTRLIVFKQPKNSRKKIILFFQQRICFYNSIYKSQNINSNYCHLFTIKDNIVLNLCLLYMFPIVFFFLSVSISHSLYLKLFYEQCYLYLFFLDFRFVFLFFTFYLSPGLFAPNKKKKN